MRPDEVSKITLRDIDLQRGLLSVRTSKLGAERTIKLKETAIMNLRTYIQRKNFTELNVRLFPKPDKLDRNGTDTEKEHILTFETKSY